MPSGDAAAFQQSASLADLQTLILAGKHKGHSSAGEYAGPVELVHSLDSSGNNYDAYTLRQRQK